MLDVVRRVAQAAGGYSQLAAILAVTRPALYAWKQVPANRVIPLEKASLGTVSRSEIRPDLYPPEDMADATRAGNGNGAGGVPQSDQPVSPDTEAA